MLGKRMPGRLSIGVATVACFLLVGLLVLAASPALAEVYHVKLRNGTTIDTAYQPQQASWDSNLVVLLSDAGNWIGIPQQDVATVVAESQDRGGFGVALNFNTVAIGWAPNDAPEPGAQSAQASALQALQSIYQQQQAQSHYTIPQFVNTDQTQGIPSRFIGVSPQMQIPTQVTLPPPPAPTPPAPAPNQ
jgi:hypothetical protein